MKWEKKWCGLRCWIVYCIGKKEDRGVVKLWTSVRRNSWECADKIKVVKLWLWWCIWIDGRQTDRPTNQPTNCLSHWHRSVQSNKQTYIHTHKGIKLQDLLKWKLSVFYRIIHQTFDCCLQLFSSVCWGVLFRLSSLSVVTGTDCFCHVFLMGDC